MAEETNVKLGADVAGLFRGMDQAAKSVQNSTSIMAEHLGGLGSIASMAGNKVAALGELGVALGPLAIAVVGVGLAFKALSAGVDYVRESILATNELADTFDELAFTTGATTEQLNTYNAAMKMMGGDVQTVGGWLNGMTRAIKANSDQLVEQGIATSKAELMGLSFEEYLKRVVTMGDQMANTNERNKLNMLAFGRAGVAASEQMNEFVSRLEDGAAAAEEFGMTLNGEDITAMEEFKKATGTLDVALEGLQLTITRAVLPVVQQFAEFVRDNIGPVLDFAKESIWGIRVAFMSLSGTVEEVNITTNAFWKILADPMNATAIWTESQLEIQLAAMNTETAIQEVIRSMNKVRESTSSAPTGKKTVKDESDSKTTEIVSTDFIGAYQAQANAKAEQEGQRHRQQMTAIGVTGIKSSMDAELAGYALEREFIDRNVALGLLTEDQRVQKMRELAQQELDTKIFYTNALIEAEADPAKRAEMQAQIEEMNRAHKLRMTQMDTDAAIESASAWKSFSDSFKLTLEDQIAGMLGATQGLTTSWQNMMGFLGKSLDKAIAQMLVRWISGESIKTQATAGGLAARGTLEAGAALKSVALAIWEGLKWIGIQGWKAAAGAYNAIVSIPYVGPFLAPVAAGVALAAVVGFGSKIASAEGGYDIPAGVNPVTQLHEQEMVLPKAQANVIRDMAEGGGSGGMTFHITTMDAKSFESALRDNSSSLVRVMKDLGRDGRMG